MRRLWLVCILLTAALGFSYSADSKTLVVTYTEVDKTSFGWSDSTDFTKKPIEATTDETGVLTERTFSVEADGSAKVQAWVWYITNSATAITLETSASKLMNGSIELPYSADVDGAAVTPGGDSVVINTPKEASLTAARADSFLYTCVIEKDDISNAAAGDYSATLTITISSN